MRENTRGGFEVEGLRPTRRATSRRRWTPSPRPAAARRPPRNSSDVGAPHPSSSSTRAARALRVVDLAGSERNRVSGSRGAGARGPGHQREPRGPRQRRRGAADGRGARPLPRPVPTVRGRAGAGARTASSPRFAGRAAAAESASTLRSRAAARASARAPSGASTSRRTALERATRRVRELEAAAAAAPAAGDPPLRRRHRRARRRRPAAAPGPSTRPRRGARRRRPDARRAGPPCGLARRRRGAAAARAEADSWTSVLPRTSWTRTRRPPLPGAKTTTAPTTTTGVAAHDVSRVPVNGQAGVLY